MREIDLTVRTSLFAQVVGEEIEGDQITYCIWFRGRIPTHVVGVDPDDGGLEYHYEVVDETEDITFPVHTIYQDIRKAVEQRALAIEQDVLDGCLDSRQVRETNRQLNYNLDHAA